MLRGIVPNSLIIRPDQLESESAKILPTILRSGGRSTNTSSQRKCDRWKKLIPAHVKRVLAQRIRSVQLRCALWRQRNPVVSQSAIGRKKLLPIMQWRHGPGTGQKFKDLRCRRAMEIHASQSAISGEKFGALHPRRSIFLDVNCLRGPIPVAEQWNDRMGRIERPEHNSQRLTSQFAIDGKN